MDQPKKPVRLQLTPEEEARIAIARKRHEDSQIDVSPEWMAIARLGKHYGWLAIEAVLGKETTDNPSSELMAVLIEGGDRVDAGKTYLDHQAAFVGAASANSKKPSKAFESMTKVLKKRSMANG